jgi:hypothetical protein
VGVLEKIQASPASGLEVAIQDEAKRASLALGITRSQARVVRESRRGAHGNGRIEPTEAMDMSVGGWTRDRPALPRRQGQLAIERGGDLEREERQAVHNPVIKDQVQLGALLAQDAFDHGNALRS